MTAGIADLLIQQGETFKRVISPLVTKTSARASVNTVALVASQSIVFATGGLGAISVGDTVQFGTKQYKATNSIADLSAGGTLTIDKPITGQIEVGAVPTIFAPYSLSGHTARASIRSTADSTVLVVNFTSAIVSDTIEVSLTDIQTSALLTPDKQFYNQKEKYTWDLEIVDGSGNVTRLLNGIVRVSPEVTR